MGESKAQQRNWSGTRVILTKQGSSTDDPTRRDRSRAASAIMLSMVLFIAVMVCGRHLIEGPFPLGQQLIWTYVGYAVASIALTHAVFFAAVFDRKARGRAPLSNKVPKALEYIYTAVIGLSLCQIAFAGPQLADFIRVKYGEEGQLLQQMRDQAQIFVDGECKTKKAETFTPAFCESMSELVKADNLLAFVLDAVDREADFLFHYVGPPGSRPPKHPGLRPPTSEQRIGKGVGEGKGIGKGVRSPQLIQDRPFLDRALQVHALAYYAADPIDKRLSNLLAWTSLLLLPIGIALRLVKTSLELFGGLK